MQEPGRVAWRPVALVLVGAAVLLAAVRASTFDPPWVTHPLTVVAAVWWVAMLVCLPRSLGALTCLAAALLARVLTWQPTVHMHFAKSYGLMISAQGQQSIDHRYGDAYAATHSLVWSLLGRPSDAVHLADVALSALVAPFLFHTVQRLTSDDRAAWFAGLCAALLPLGVALSSTETRMVLAATLAVTATSALLRRDAVGDLLALVAIGLLAHTRPLQIPTALVLVAMGWQGHRRWAVAGASALLAWRFAELGTYLAADGTTQGLQFHAWTSLLDPAAWFGRDGALVALDPTRTPMGVVLLATAGIALALQRPRRPVLWLVALAVIAVLPYLPQGYPVDRLRFQLPQQVWLAALAGLGAARVTSWPRPAAVAVLLGVLATWWPARAPYPPYTWQVEYGLLRQTVDQLPPGTVVLYSDTQDKDAAVRTWLQQRFTGQWYPVRGPEPEGALRWVGTADRLQEAAPVPWHRLTPLFERATPPVFSDLLDVGPEPIRMGLYKVGPLDAPTTASPHPP